MPEFNQEGNRGFGFFPRHRKHGVAQGIGDEALPYAFKSLKNMGMMPQDQHGAFADAGPAKFPLKRCRHRFKLVSPMNRNYDCGGMDFLFHPLDISTHGRNFGPGDTRAVRPRGKNAGFHVIVAQKRQPDRTSDDNGGAVGLAFVAASSSMGDAHRIQGLDRLDNSIGSSVVQVVVCQRDDRDSCTGQVSQKPGIGAEGQVGGLVRSAMSPRSKGRLEVGKDDILSFHNVFERTEERGTTDQSQAFPGRPIQENVSDGREAELIKARPLAGGRQDRSDQHGEADSGPQGPLPEEPPGPVSGIGEGTADLQTRACDASSPNRTAARSVSGVQTPNDRRR